jgi:hypothetical protein
MGIRVDILSLARLGTQRTVERSRRLLDIAVQVPRERMETLPHKRSAFFLPEQAKNIQELARMNPLEI